MNTILKFYVIILIMIMVLSCVNNSDKKEKVSEQPYLVVLSLDGFRWDYCEKANTPVLDSLAKVGSVAESVKPSFPTKTFPNHYAIATGLYPDNHGIVLNNFYAPDLKKDYAVRDRNAVQNGEFYNGTPIWNAAENNGVKALSLFWVGSSADIQGKRPSYWFTYDKQLSLDSRIDTLVKYLSEPEDKRPHFLMWYYYEPDSKGHEFGPNSEEVVQEVEKLDNFLGRFFTAMRKLPIYNKLNFIITSDHGMGELSPDREIFIDEIVDTALIDFVDGGNPIMNIKAKDGKVDVILSNLNNSGKNLKAWKHGELPERLHYGNNIRTHDITVVADSSWSIGWSWKPYKGYGTHGYDNNNKDMHAIFFAAGPAFKVNHIQPQFNNVDIYSLMAKVIEIEAPMNDGNFDNVKGMLK
jgi:alkaline phosphatase D